MIYRLLISDFGYEIYQGLDVRDQAALAIALGKRDLSPPSPRRKAPPVNERPSWWGLLVQSPNEMHYHVHTVRIRIAKPMHHAVIILYKNHQFPTIHLLCPPKQLTVVIRKQVDPKTVHTIAALKPFQPEPCSSTDRLLVISELEWIAPPATKTLDAESCNSRRIRSMEWESCENDMAPWISELPNLLPDTQWELNTETSEKRWIVSDIRGGNKLTNSYERMSFLNLDAPPCSPYLHTLEISYSEAADFDLGDVLDQCPRLTKIEVIASPNIRLSRCSRANVHIKTDEVALLSSPAHPIQLASLTLILPRWDYKRVWTENAIPIHATFMKVQSPNIHVPEFITCDILTIHDPIQLLGLRPQRGVICLTGNDMTPVFAWTRGKICVRAGVNIPADVADRVYVFNKKWISHPVRNQIRDMCMVHQLILNNTTPS